MCSILAVVDNTLLYNRKVAPHIQSSIGSKAQSVHMCKCSDAQNDCLLGKTCTGFVTPSLSSN